jgi:DNA-binding GntR family transcriptional regulator
MTGLPFSKTPILLAGAPGLQGPVDSIGFGEILVQEARRSIYRGSIMASRSNRDSDTRSPPLELNPADVDRSASLRDQIYELLRMRIVIGVMRPGQVVNEIEIAAQLGLSRTPVREAVKRISDEGLIVIRAQNGTFVADFSRAALDEAYLIRQALEFESVRRAAVKASPDDIDKLEDTIAAHETAIKRHRFPEAIRLDDMFHRQIAEISSLSMLWKAVDISKAQMDRGRHLALPHPGMGEVTIAQHEAIVAALRKGDRVQAGRAMKEHLDTSLQNTLLLLDQARQMSGSEDLPAEGNGKSGRGPSTKPATAEKVRPPARRKPMKLPT